MNNIYCQYFKVLNIDNSLINKYSINIHIIIDNNDYIVNIY